MKIEELRIGNLVNYEQTTHKIISIESETNMTKSVWMSSPYLVKDTYYHDISELKPIDLSEQAVLNLGFRRLDKYTFVCKGVFIYHRKRGFVFGSVNRKCILKSIHHLQNLYFALKQEELIYKL